MAARTETTQRRGKPTQWAAGGLVERASPEGTRIAVVHRTRYSDLQGGDGDWVLPKGKPDAGETIEETALREVKEETGCTGRIVGPGFRSEYLVRDTPKVVTFFPMECVNHGATVDATEVREVVWLTPREAFERLTYDTERAVLGEAYPELRGHART